MTLWELRTAGAAYVVRETDAGLELAHWGRPVRVVPPRGSFETPADIAPLEFAAAGTRHAQGSELLVPGGASLWLVPAPSRSPTTGSRRCSGTTTSGWRWSCTSGRPGGTMSSSGGRCCAPPAT